MKDPSRPGPGGAPENACYPFAFAVAFRLPLRVIGVRPDTCSVRVGGGTLDVRFGRWRLRTELDNICSAEFTGPYQAWKVIGGPRLSLADRGLSFATNATAGVCIGFHHRVPGLLATRRLRHPALTVTVAEPHRLVEHLRRQEQHHPASPEDPRPS